MELRRYVGKRVRLTDVDEQVFIGDCIDFAQPSDNDSEVASVAIKTTGLTYELYENEIKSIEILD